MNDCVNGDIRDVLPELVNGTLPAGETARVQEHVRACADCAAEVELLRTARAAMRIAPTMDTARIASAVQASTAQRLAARRVPARVARVATVSLVMLLAAVAVWSVRDGAGVAPTAQVAANDNKTVVVPAMAGEARGGRAPVQLALGGDISSLADDDLVALMDEVSALEAMPGEEPAALSIEPVEPVVEEEL